MTLYDLIPLYAPEYYLEPTRLTKKYHARLETLRQADLVLTISEFTRQEALRLLNLPSEKVITIGAGVSPYFRPPSQDGQPMAIVQAALPVVRPGFILSVLGADNRKNSTGLIEAYAMLPSALRRAHQLVIACDLPQSYEAHLRAHAVENGLAENEVVFTGYVPDPLLRALYQAAHLFVFPSLYEGFGLPAAEAIACDCPTLTSNTSSLPEILAWEPATFDPYDPAAMAAAIERGLTDAAFRDQLRSLGRRRAPLFRWPVVAERLVAALAHLPRPGTSVMANGLPTSTRSVSISIMRGSSPGVRRRSDLRLALVGPLPPSSCGLAAHNSRLVEALAASCGIDLFSTAGDRRLLSGAWDGVRCFPAEALGYPLNPWAYDAVVYMVDRCTGRTVAYELALRYRGIVWLHDLHLGAPDCPLLEGVRRCSLGTGRATLYGDRVPRPPPDLPSAEPHVHYRLRLAQQWVRVARAVLVNTQGAQQRVALDQGPNGSCPPLWRLPMACPAPIDQRSGDAARGTEPPLIVALGQVHPLKLPEVLLDALRLVRLHVPARLVFVGPIGPGQQALCEAEAIARGVRAAVQFTGEVTAAEYAAWVQRATCAVQLRRSPDIGGTAAIADCLSAGLPVVTNLPDAAQEYGEAVRALPTTFAAEELAACLVELLTEPALWKRQRAAALAFAARHTYATLASALLGIVSQLQDMEGLHASARLSHGLPRLLPRNTRGDPAARSSPASRGG
jgi:glycosyltransferase involved in cell wall biosynthesis